MAVLKAAGDGRMGGGDKRIDGQIETELKSTVNKHLSPVRRVKK